MAKKQTRRCVSMNRSIFEAAKKEAARRGLTFAAFVESALAAAGVTVVAHPQQTPTQVEAHPARRAARVEARRNDTKPRQIQVQKASPRYLPSLERQMLGDGVANAHGFR